jgi:RNA polymerase sigma factor (sigma-70 family)
MADGPLSSVLRHLRTLIGPSRAEELTDSQLLERFTTRREEAAFAALVQRHGPMVFGVCRRLLRNLHDAEDAFQATFLVLVRKAASLDGQRSLGNWLYTVASRLALKVRANAAKRRARERQVADMFPKGPEEETDCQELRPVLDEELNRLPEKYRAPLVLCYLQGKTNEQAAHELGWPVGSMSRRLARGRELLRQGLVRRGVTLSASVLGSALAGQTAEAVPVVLVQTTLKAALAVAAGQALGAASPPVAALVEGMVQQMFLAKLKTITTVVLALSLVAAGAGVFAYRALADRPQEPSKAAEPRPAPGPDKPAHAAPNGDPLPADALARLGTARFRHGGHISSVAFSPDSKTLASAGADQTLRLWEVATGKELLRLRELGEVHAVAFSPDGKTLASGSAGNAVRLWDVATGKVLLQFQGHQRAVRSVAFAPDGKRLASASDDKTVLLWDPTTGQQVGRLSGHQGEVYAATFAGDGKTLVSGSKDGTLRLWDVATAQELRQFTGQPGGNYCTALSPDGKILALGGDYRDRTVWLWETATGKGVHQLRGHVNGAQSVAFSPDGKGLASAGWHGDDVIRLWDIATGKEIRQCKPNLASGTLAFSPDGKILASAGMNHSIQLWDVATGKELPQAAGHQSLVFGCAFSPDGKSLATLGGNDAGTLDAIRVWDIATGKEVRQFGRGIRKGFSLAFSPDGKTLASTGGYDHSVHLWDLATGTELRQYKGPNGDPAFAVAFSADGKTLVSGGGHTVHVWDVATGKEMHQLPKCQGSTLALSPAGSVLATAGFDRVIRLWDLATGNELRQFGVGVTYGSLAFTGDGAALISGDYNGQIRVWEAATGKELRHFGRQQKVIRSLALSPDGRTLVEAGDNDVYLWEMATGKEVRRFTGHAGQVWSVAFSPDGRTVASGSFDTTALVWDVTSRVKNGRFQPAKHSTEELLALWADLGGEDATKAHQAGWSLTAASQQTVAFVQDQLGTVEAGDPKVLKQLIADLDNDDFATREKATAALERLGKAAESALRKELAGTPKVEARRRIEAILKKLQGDSKPDATRLRTLRVLAVLEQIGTAEARKVLESLAKNAPEPEVVREAKAALERLGKRAFP